MRPAVVVADGLGVEYHRPPHLDRAVGKVERGRHHTDDLGCLAIEQHRLPDDRRVRAEPTRPDRVAQHHNICTARLLLFRQKRAADLRSDTEQRKQAGRDHRPFDALRTTVAGEVESQRVVRGELLEGVAPIAIVHVLAGGRRDLVDSGPMQIAPDHHQPVRVPIRQRAQDHAIHHREDRGVGADAESEREEHHRGEALVLAQRAERVAHIGGDDVGAQARAPRPHRIHIVFHGAHRFIGRRAGRAQLVVLIVEMLAELLADVTRPVRHAPLR